MTRSQARKSVHCLHLDDILEENSLETSGEEEEEEGESSLETAGDEEDSDDFLTPSSADCTLRLSGRSSDSETGEESVVQCGKTVVSEKWSQRSQDSGYSDLSEDVRDPAQVTQSS